MTAIRHHRLDNPIAVVDPTGSRLTGSTKDVCQFSQMQSSPKS
jgi:transketolase N-terminal domain/subunit